MSEKFLLPEDDIKKRRKAKKTKFPQPKWFIPDNPSKYVGDASKIVARSNLERRFFKIFDTNKNVIKWASEEMVIKYVSSVDNQIHRYFPDCVIQIRTRSGATKTYIIEIKPASQCVPPKSRKRHTKRFLQESVTYQTNQDKWKAAKDYCSRRGIEFMVLTEEHLGGF